MGMSEELFDEILRRYCKGETIKAICESYDSDITYDAFHRWMSKDPRRISRMHAAQLVHAGSIFDDIVYISDTDPDPKRARNRMFSRSLVAGRYDRDRFGDKSVASIDHNINIQMSVDQARQRMINVTSQPLVIQQQSPTTTSDIRSDVDDAFQNGTGIFS